MAPPLLATLGVAGFLVAYFHWMNHVIPEEYPMSGDTWYMRHMAFTDLPVTAPYCWRPLLPRLARYFGFFAVSYSASIATTAVIYFCVGGGWRGFLCALIFMANGNIFHHNIRNPAYAEGLGQLLMISSVWAMGTGSLIAWPLFLLAALCRETIAASLGLVAVFWNPLLLIPLVLGSCVAYLTRKEDKDNRHPLVEATPYDTLVRWARFKGLGAISYAHVIQPLRGLAIAVPFVWNDVGHFARLGLVGLIPIWLLALPASGQSRIMCYGFAYLIPFAAALDGPWLGVVTLLSVFWIADVRAFDETGGGKTFGFVR